MAQDLNADQGSPKAEGASPDPSLPQAKVIASSAVPVPPPEEEEQEQKQATVADEVGDALQTVLPWMTSLLFHVAIVVLALFVVWSVAPVLEEDDVPIIPSARLTDKPGGALSQSESVQMESTAQNVRNVQSESVSTDQAIENLNTNLDSNLELVGVSGGAASDGGKLAPFGTTAEGGIKADFYGTGGNARKIIYIVDASGSLIDSLPFVIQELKDSISGLSDQQQYSIIFFQAGDPIEVPPKGWKTANAEIKRLTMDWISLESAHIIPRGKTDPIKAIQMAIRYKPELVFVLSDNITGRGEYEVDRAELLKFLKDNTDPKTKINTIQFLYPDSLNTLKDIAAQHGGIYKFVTEEDLGLR